MTYLFCWILIRGTHPRLGSTSLLRLLDTELCRLVAWEAAKYIVSPPRARQNRDAEREAMSMTHSRGNKTWTLDDEEAERRPRQGIVRRALRGDFESVAAAVAAVPSGSRVYLLPGVYREPPMLVTARSLSAHRRAMPGQRPLHSVVAS